MPKPMRRAWQARRISDQRSAIRKSAIGNQQSAISNRVNHTMVKRLVWVCLAFLIAVCTWTVAEAADDRGQQVYESNCRQCHGVEGRGGKGPRLVPFTWTYAEALELIRHPICDMPPIPAADVSDAEVAEIVTYLKTIK